MFHKTATLIFTVILCINCYGQNIYVSYVNFRVEAGTQMCVFETGKAGQMLEVYYQVLDGQHGDLDISFEVKDPNGVNLVTDFKSSQNSIILDLEVDGDYSFCMDNTYSLFNSKLVFFYIIIEDKNTVSNAEEVSTIDADGVEQNEVLKWAGIDDDGQAYSLEISHLADSLTRTLGNVVKSRHLLDIYGATKSRDSYMAFEDTFIVDLWSGFQISLMCIVGMLQVYMIKKLFTSTEHGYKSFY